MIEENRKEQQTKICGKCGRELSLERFSDKKKKSSWCKNCCSTYISELKGFGITEENAVKFKYIKGSKLYSLPPICPCGNIRICTRNYASILVLFVTSCFLQPTMSAWSRKSMMSICCGTISKARGFHF